MNLRNVDLTKLNSITKYPSIPTYHPMGERGLLGEVPMTFEGPVFAAEKIDGTNARIVLIGGTRDYLLGSREELLHSRGDLIHNPAMGIVDAVRPLADRLADTVRFDDGVRIFYVEVFGGNVGGNAKQYTGEKRVSFRLFDIVDVPDAETRLESAPEAIASWREGGDQSFATVPELREMAAELALETVPLILEVSAEALPRTLSETRDFLREALPTTRVTLDGGACGRAEGLVVRTSDRRQIAKLRFEDYERTLRRKGG